MKINVIKTSSGFAAIAGILAASGAAQAADQGDCAAYKPTLPHIYVAGSSAVKPFVQALTTYLADKEVVVYVSQGSCVGVGDIVNSTAIPTATAGTIGADTCTTAAGTKADLGVSDVFAESCADFPKGLPAGVGDFHGPVQVMNFVVPKAADAAITSISAEAAYLVFGFDPSAVSKPTDGTPWTSKDDVWMRGPGSGTQSMLAAAIGVPPAAWALNTYAAGMIGGKAENHGLSGSGVMVNVIGAPTGKIDATIGILASNELDDNRATIRGLAYQHYGQVAAYWPDSTSSSKDKLNVRTGRYPVWGPLHMLTAVDAKGAAKNAAVGELVDFIQTGSSIVDIEVAKNLIPQCAMEVSRDKELGEYMSVNPTCACYYDKARGGDISKCTPCEADKTCKDKSLTCSYGYCEAL